MRDRDQQRNHQLAAGVGKTYCLSLLELDGISRKSIFRSLFSRRC